MSTTAIDWDQDVVSSKEESYQSLQNALNRNQGFGLYFVRSSPVQTQTIIEDIKRDLPNKNIGVLPLTDEVDNLFNIITNLPNYQNLNVLFISGLELSLLRYEEREAEGLFLPSQSAVYGGTWAGVPRILGHLNLSRERFREHFPFSIVFCLPEFALRYFIRRAPDFFDWRSGVYEFPTEQELVNSEAYRLVSGKDVDLEIYRTWTPQERLQRLTEIRAYLSESPDSERASELWFQKGLIHTVNEQAEEAITSYDNALKIKPDYASAWNNRGFELGNLGRGEEAITSLDNALKFKPDYHDAWINRGFALGNLGRNEEAIASYDEALKIKPDYHYAWINRGVALSNLGSKEEAIASYEQALKIKPDDHDAWYNRGAALGNLGRNEEAIISYDEALKIKSDYHLAWFGRGAALANLGRNEEAITFYDEALKIKPDYHDAWFGRGAALANLGRNEEAIAFYDEALKIKPDYHEVWHNRGAALSNLGRNEEAIASYDNALKIKPDYHEAWFSRGNALLNLGRNEKAIISYDEALKFKPDYLDALDNRGVALFKLGRYDEMILSCDKCLEIKSDYANAYYNKACAYALQENIPLAIENLKQAINLDSKYLEMAKTDTDFDKIRNTLSFQSLITEKF
jgi:tetratricopeptide (TPR) repeat protein